MSDILDFYRGDNNSVGDINTIIETWTDADWENTHDFIQWLFPLKTPSNFNPDAPILTDDDIKYFEFNYPFQSLLFEAFLRFLNFIGLSYCETVEKNENFLKKEGIWKYPNHNWLRITRVLASLYLLGRKKDAEAFFAYLCKLYNEGYGSEESFKFWCKAANGEIV